MEGAKHDGVEGFVKGTGKGLLGLVARPVTGVLDFASGSIEAVRRLIGKSDVDPVRIRPTRHIGPEGIIRPYNQHEAEGSYIFNDLRNGKKELRTDTDEYYTHLVTTRERRYILLLTNNRVIYLERGDVFKGRFSIEWMYKFDALKRIPEMTDRGILFSVIEPEEHGLKGLVQMDAGESKARYVFVEDADAGESILGPTIYLPRLRVDISLTVHVF